jgi:hypothetical protein
MLRKRMFLGVGLALVLTAGLLAAQTDYYRRTDVFQFVNGFVLGEAKLSGMTTPSTGVAQVGGTDVTTLSLVAATASATLDANGARRSWPATQTIAAGNTVAADACGGVKAITAAGAVTTSTTDTFTAPSAANAGCLMVVCNVGATNTITLDKNANTLLTAGADVALLANSCVSVMSNGTVWRQIGAIQTST